MTGYDAIVVGVGGVGSAALAHLAERGWRVLGLDPHAPPHSQGSSHGQTRIIRQAYFEHPNYVPLLRRAYELWNELQQRFGQQLFFPVGLVQIGPPEGEVLSGVRASAREHGLAVDWLTADQCARRFPMLPISPEHQAVFERNAGYLRVEDCVTAHFQWALASGAEFRQQPVQSWRAIGETVEVVTDTDTYQCANLVVTGGPWAAQLLHTWQLPLTVCEKHLHWFPIRDPRLESSQGCPCYLYELPHGCFYGFPAVDAAGVKMAEHSGGTTIDSPDVSLRQRDEEDLRRVTEFAASFPDVVPTPSDHAVCFYTLTPDRHFIVDRHPQVPQIVAAAGLSGHGFKFASALGEILADWVTAGVSPLPVDFLRARPDRFA